MALLRTYHKIVSPRVQPIEVEREFNLPIEDVNYSLKEYIDVIHKDNLTIDHKTTKRSMKQDTLDSDLQLTAYSLVYRKLTGKEEKGLRFDVMVRTRGSRIQQIQTYMRQQDMDRLAKLFRQVKKAIESGIFYPNQNFMCPNCGYRDLCKMW